MCEFAAADVEYLYTYDESGNLIAVSSKSEETESQYDMTYDQEGRLEKYAHSMVGAEAADAEAETMVYSDDRLTYTDAGLLLSFGEDYTYEYDGDKLIKIDELGESCSFSYNGDIPQDQSSKRIYDGNGCLVKQFHEDGSYTEYDYMELTLSEADTLRYRRQQQIYLSPIGRWLALSYYEPLDFTLPVPLVMEYKR